MSRSSFGAGFEDGTICIFNLNDKDSNVLFKGHKSAVTCMVFDEDSNTIFSGSKDSIIIAWDVANECGLFRYADP
jgi:U3 small nucleolar RNA-associated protein 12